MAIVDKTHSQTIEEAFNGVAEGGSGGGGGALVRIGTYYISNKESVSIVSNANQTFSTFDIYDDDDNLVDELPEYDLFVFNSVGFQDRNFDLVHYVLEGGFLTVTLHNHSSSSVNISASGGDLAVITLYRFGE